MAQWLERWTSDLAVMGSIPGPGLIRHLGQLSLPYPSRAGKSSTSLHRLGLRRGAFTCVGWQVTLCDPIWQVTPCSSVMGFHSERNTALIFFNSEKKQCKIPFYNTWSGNEMRLFYNSPDTTWGTQHRQSHTHLLKHNSTSGSLWCLLQVTVNCLTENDATYTSDQLGSATQVTQNTAPSLTHKRDKCCQE